MCVCAVFPVSERHHRPLLPVSSSPYRRQKPQLQPAEPVSALRPSRILHDRTELALMDEVDQNRSDWMSQTRSEGKQMNKQS